MEFDSYDDLPPHWRNFDSFKEEKKEEKKLFIDKHSKS